MDERNKKFLNFNGKNINVLTKDGNYWVALKPICQILNLNWNRQIQNLKEDKILGRVYAIQHTHDSSNRVQEMICLPERYIYGWLFSINSNSAELELYKEECYDALYNHFHGATIERMELLKIKSKEELELEESKKKLFESELYKDVKLKEAKLKETQKKLPLNDVRFLQGSLFD
jgi:hypothetical protein